ncbi:MAG: TolC family protein [Terracidiphilus sp.]
MNPCSEFGREAGLRRRSRLAWATASLLLSLAAPGSYGQAPGAATPAEATSAPKPAAITLDDAIRLAQASEPAYAAAVAAKRTAGLDKSIALAGLLPNVSYYNQGLYTEPNGAHGQVGQESDTPDLPKFIANNGVREYFSQGIVNETLGLGPVAALRHADAAAAMASAEQEIARRGLLEAVTTLFFNSMATDKKLAVAEQARQEAADFTKLTTAREEAREAAHADVVKAQLQEQQRDRDFEDAQVVAEKARLELGVLLFSDPRTPYTLSAPEAAPALASKEDVEQAAAKNNPELKSALAALAASNADVQAAWGALLPNVGLNVTYGIDAPQFAVNGPDGVRNLGYSASVTVNVPVWDWLASEHKVKQSEIRRDAVQVALSATRRRLIAQLEEAYGEAQAARDQLASLDQSAALAAESLHLTKLRYSAGEATVLEVVDAENTYVTAEDARADGRVRYESARAALLTIAGTM